MKQNGGTICPIIADKFPGVEDREKRGFVLPYFTKGNA